MNMTQIKAVIKKEMKELKNDKAVIFGIIIVPLVLIVILPIIFFIFGCDEKNLHSLNGLVEPFGEKVKQIVPSYIENKNRAIYIVYRYLFTPIILIIPVIISNVLASNSFVGEKEKKTIEALFYTPIRKENLIMGKTLASVIPTLIITWIFNIIYILIANIAGKRILEVWLFPNLDWIIMFLLIVPAITFLSILLVIVVSQKMNTSKSAQSISMLLVMPLVGSVISQAVGAIIFNARSLFVVFGIIVLIDIVVFRVAVKHFSKEKYILNM